LQQAYERVRQGEAESLPEVLVTSGVVTPEELTSTLSSQYQEVRLGQILFISGYLTEEQLTEGLRRQSETGELLGEALCALGHCDPTVIQTALSQQLGGG